VPNLISIFRFLGRFAEESILVRVSIERCVTHQRFYGGGLLAPRPTPKLEDHPLSAVRDCLFNIFAATLRIWRPSPPSLLNKLGIIFNAVESSLQMGTRDGRVCERGKKSVHSVSPEEKGESQFFPLLVPVEVTCHQILLLKEQNLTLIVRVSIPLRLWRYKWQWFYSSLKQFSRTSK
jgi:hypothetical protein